VVDKNLPSSSLLADWINTRAKDIFEESALVEHALALLHCAQINGNFIILGSSFLYDHFEN
jgi:hypothetical protein